ncbi:unnamed protein product [Fusarium venenatum]|uniref:Uncharacterized protein n=1 Tax=Fusarium venenatum TaxID=56646 RepID=A0A2L2SNP6_9HYPO|nr:uncharacterized protein FVRRES_11917 [Fusarium venenatum]CEI39226.1 unnamed protein product [Fusarium venenatum]
MAGNIIPGDGSPFSEAGGANERRWTESHWWPRPASRRVDTRNNGANNARLIQFCAGLATTVATAHTGRTIMTIQLDVKAQSGFCDDDLYLILCRRNGSTRMAQTLNTSTS